MLPSVIAIESVGTRIYQHTPQHIRHVIEKFRGTQTHKRAQKKNGTSNVPANSIDRLVNAVVRGSSAAVVPLLLRSSIAWCPRTRCPPPPALAVTRCDGVSRGPAAALIAAPSSTSGLAAAARGATTTWPET